MTKNEYFVSFVMRDKKKKNLFSNVTLIMDCLVTKPADIMGMQQFLAQKYGNPSLCILNYVFMNQQITDETAVEVDAGQTPTIMGQFNIEGEEPTPPVKLN